MAIIHNGLTQTLKESLIDSYDKIKGKERTQENLDLFRKSFLFSIPKPINKYWNENSLNFIWSEDDSLPIVIHHGENLLRKIEHMEKM